MVEDIAANDYTVDMTEAELAEAKRYGRLDLACGLADRAIDVAYLAAAAFLLAGPLDAWLKGCPLLAGNWSLRLAAFFLVIMTIHLLLSFPLSFYSGHVLEHQFQLSTQTFRRWLWQYLKRNLLAMAFMLVLLEGLYWLIWIAGGAWWLLAAALFFVVTILLGQLWPVLILPLFYRIEKLDVPAITDRLARLAQGTGMSIEGVYRLDLSEETVKANAMLAGLGRTRRVLLGDTLLAGFSPEEIEVIFAHEIGHHVLHHIRSLIVTGLVYSAAGFWLCDRLLAWWGPPAVARSTTLGCPSPRCRCCSHDDRVCPALATATKRHEPAVRTASRSLRVGAGRAKGRLSVRLPQAGPAEQGRSQPPLARRVPVP